MPQKIWLTRKKLLMFMAGQALKKQFLHYAATVSGGDTQSRPSFHKKLQPIPSKTAQVNLPEEYAPVSMPIRL